LLGVDVELEVAPQAAAAGLDADLPVVAHELVQPRQQVIVAAA